MEILYIGGVYPKETEVEINNNVLINYQFASNNLQWALIEGLSHFFKNLNIITAPTVGSYPFGYKKMYLQGIFFKNVFLKKSKNFSVGYINLPLLNRISKYFSIKKELNSWLKINKNKQAQVIIYSVHTPFLKPVIEAKKKYKNLSVTLIVPDLPNYMSDNNNLIYRCLKRIDNYILNRCIKEVDSFVLLSKHMKKPLEVSDRKWVLVEGIFQNMSHAKIKKHTSNKKIILYTGSLTKKDGIFNLIKAFKKIEGLDYELWLRGSGSILAEVLEIIKDDIRIKWIDKLSRNDLIILQRKATVLINPMPTSDDSAKFFFPSKMMDYLASGTPTITTRLKGIPEEYFKYCFCLDEDNPEAIKNKIIEVCELPQSDLEEKGMEARNFILKNKNPINQVQQIYCMLKK